jgi:hypothetical protein
VLSEPIVRVTLRISTNVLMLARVQQEMLEAVANTTAPLPSLFRAKGYDVSGIYLISMTSSLVRCLDGPCLIE